MIEVRPLRSGEHTIATGLVIALFEEEEWPVTGEAITALQREYRSQLGPMNWAFIAWDCQTRCAMGIIQLKITSDPTSGRRLEVFRFYVKPQYRRTKAARLLIEAGLLSAPLNADLPVIISTVSPLRNSFRRMGFGTVAHVHMAPLGRIRKAFPLGRISKAFRGRK